MHRLPTLATPPQPQHTEHSLSLSSRDGKKHSGGRCLRRWEEQEGEGDSASDSAVSLGWVTTEEAVDAPAAALGDLLIGGIVVADPKAELVGAERKAPKAAVRVPTPEDPGAGMLPGEDAEASVVVPDPNPDAEPADAEPEAPEGEVFLREETEAEVSVVSPDPDPKAERADTGPKPPTGAPTPQAPERVLLLKEYTEVIVVASLPDPKAAPMLEDTKGEVFLVEGAEVDLVVSEPDLEAENAAPPNPALSEGEEEIPFLIKGGPRGIEKILVFAGAVLGDLNPSAGKGVASVPETEAPLFGSLAASRVLNDKGVLEVPNVQREGEDVEGAVLNAVEPFERNQDFVRSDKVSTHLKEAERFP
ncbi:hypothetical protein V5O48_013669 [Marasmius crinis-equi]|uniref:Uncharacterized protein n=1 Tax=Marasmius crinis-equi TaxID=585013 RepID=A0ABR3EZK7_9AGAR